jgi:hypothetical protein
MRYVTGLISDLRFFAFVLALSIASTSCSPQIFGVSNLARSRSSSEDAFSLMNSFAGLIYFDGGAGTSASPYLICTRGDFVNISLLTSTTGKYFKQTCDFSMGGTATPHRPFVFAGTYDGNNQTISDLVVDTSSVNQVGLFQQIENTGHVHDLKITNAKIQGVAISSAQAQPAGVLAGENKGDIEDITITNSNVSCIVVCGGIVGNNSSGGTITRAYFQGNVSGLGVDGTFTSYGIGGIAGVLSDGNIRQSFTAGTLSGGFMAGGLVGFMGATASDYLYDNGTAMHISVSPAGGGGYIGGLVGYDQGLGLVHDNYTVGSLVNNGGAAATSLGGLIGAATVARDKNYAAMLGMVDYNAAATFAANGSLSAASYFYNHTTINATNDGGLLTYAQMIDSSNVATNFSGMNFTDNWALPTGAASFPFPQLRSFAFSTIHTFEMTTYKPLKIIEVPDVMTTGDTFGTVDADLGAGFVDATLTLENTTASAITIDSVSMSLGFKFAIQAGASTCDPTTIIASAATCTLVVRLFPSIVSGVQVTDSIIVQYTDGSSIARTIAHQVDATINQNDGVFSMNSYTFPVTKVGTSTSSFTTSSGASIALTNSGSNPIVNITSIVSGSAEFVYNPGSSTCLVGSPVGATTSCILDILFSPSSAGWKESTITITYDGSGVTGKTIDIVVQGVGSATMAGTNANPFEVWTAQDLAGMDIIGEYHQMANISLDGYTCDTFVMGSTFSGTYDGQNFTVSNLCGRALFRSPASGVTLQNLNLDGFTITSTTYAGTLAEELTSATVDGVHVTQASITGTLTAAGGLAGRVNVGSTISNSSVDDQTTISVTGGTPGAAGGLVGWLIQSNITNSNSEAAVTLNAAFSSSTGAGGLVGVWDIQGGNYSITDSYSTGELSSTTFSGGLIGNTTSTTMVAGTGTILRSFASGDVLGGAASGLAMVSQFIGAHSLAIQESFASGNVSGGYSWGLSGAYWGGAITAANSFSSGTISATTGDAIGFGPTATDSYCAALSVTDLGFPTGNGITIMDSGVPGDENYFYESGVGYDPLSTGTPLNAAAMVNSASFPGFDFPGKWRMPITNPFSPINSPVPAWLCGSHGVSCF